MALAFGRRRLTRDLDAVFEPKREIYQAAAEIARERGLPDNWLNDAVKGLLPDKTPPIEGTSSFSAKGIHVGVASAEYLFAMKAAAARQEADGEDLLALARILKIKSAKQALDLVDRFYGKNRLTMKTQLIIEAVMAEIDGERTAADGRADKPSGRKSGEQPDRPKPAARRRSKQ
jgi:hypothetical protein